MRPRLAAQVEVPPFNQKAYDSTLASLRQRQATLRDLPADRAAQEGDTVRVDMAGYEQVRPFLFLFFFTPFFFSSFFLAPEPPRPALAQAACCRSCLRSRATAGRSPPKIPPKKTKKTKKNARAQLGLRSPRQLPDGSKGAEVNVASGSDLTVELFPGRCARRAFAPARPCQ